jgi:large subunit ribosomal protein L10
MAKTRAQKEGTLQTLTKNFKDAASVVFADYRGITVAQVDALRKKMRDADVRYVVAKKSLVTRAAKDAGYDVDAKKFDGMIGVAFGMTDVVAPAKVFGDVSKTTTLQIVGGVFEGAVVGKEKMVALSKLPSRQELLGTVVGTIYAPVSAFVRVLNAVREARAVPAGRQEAGAPAPAAVPVAEAPVAEVAEAPAPEVAAEAPAEAPQEVPAEPVAEVAPEAPAEPQA